MKILLYSGGMDSYLIRALWKPDKSVYVDLRSAYTIAEISHLRIRCKEISIWRDSLDLSSFERDDKIIPYRNAYLVLIAANIAEHISPIEEGLDSIVEICIGATAGDRVLDKSLLFTFKMSELLTILSTPQHWTADRGREFSIVLPYKDYTKLELLREFIVKGGDLKAAFKESFSCYNPIHIGSSYYECWKCKPCIRKVVAFTLAGYKDISSIVIESVRDVIEKEILPQIIEGVYSRGREEREILEFLEQTC